MIRVFATSIVLILLGSGLVHGQSLERLGLGGGAAYYSFVDPSDIPIQIKVWGAANNPGLYEVPQGLHLSTLLTLAGGPTTGLQTRSNRRTLTLRLFRPRQGAPHEILFETRMQDEIFVFEDDPVLQSGDVLIVEEQIRGRFGWRDGISLASAMGTLILVIDRLINLAN